MLWPHQTQAITDIDRLLSQGSRRICVTSPTGGGKSRVMTELIKRYADQRIVLYTNRKVLTDQLSNVLHADQVSHGVRAAEHTPDLFERIQVSSLQTEVARVIKTSRWPLHTADLVLIDEAHSQKGASAVTVTNKHFAAGAKIIGFTATPIALDHMYDHLVVAGTNSELRKCGAHVPCHTYGPDEPDTRHIKRMKTGEYMRKDIAKIIMTQVIFGRCYDWWKRLNPDGRPTILFAPGVNESQWFAEQFTMKGVRTAHIDGSKIWVRGKQDESNKDTRAELIDRFRTGEIKVLCNRFVMREGIDIPEIYHCILATVFGSVQSFLQAGGRLLRSHPSLDHVILQDHGGNWWQHGSLNADRQWHLKHTSRFIRELRADRFRFKQEEEPLCCPKCSGVRSRGVQCPYCGHVAYRKSRKVVQVDGTLKEMKGDIFKPRRIATKPDTQKLWDQMYFRSRKAGRTFRAAETLFYIENYYYPPRNLHNMPMEEMDWYRRVKDVPRHHLYGSELTM